MAESGSQVQGLEGAGASGGAEVTQVHEVEQRWGGSRGVRGMPSGSRLALDLMRLGAAWIGRGLSDCRCIFHALRSEAEQAGN